MKVASAVKSLAVAGLVGFGMTLSVTVTGCLTDDKKDSSTTSTDSCVTTPAKCVSKTPYGAGTALTAGAQGNTSYGSALDLDSKTVMLSAAANAAQGNIDLVFDYTGGSLTLESPVAAKAESDVTLANNYDASLIHDTKMLRVTTAPGTVEDAKAAFDGATATVNKYAIHQGDIIIVKTHGGNYAVLTVTTLTGTDKMASGVFTVQVHTL